MKRTFLKAGAAIGVVSVAVLAAGPAMAANPDSQATAQSLQLSIGGKSAVSQKVTAINYGQGQIKNNANTVPQLSQLLPANTLLGLGVAPQDAFALTNGTSSACAGLAGQGGGIVQTGSKPCVMNQGKPVTLNLANATLGPLLAANNNAALTPLTNALQAIFGPANSAAINPILAALKAIPINANIVLDGVGAHCQAAPGTASGAAGIAHLHVTLTIAGTSVDAINLQANGTVNEKLVGNLSASSATLTSAIQKAVKGALTPLTPGSPINPLLGAVGQVAGVVATLVGTVQTAILDPVTAALKPLTDALSQNVLEVTFNKQPVPQAPGTFDVTALDLQVLPAAQKAIGASLISGDIGHVTCGPNAGPGKHVTPPPTNPPTAPPSGHVPTGIDSGLAGGNNTGTIIAAMSVLLAAGGAAGTAAYRRYWMPRG